MAEHCKGEDEGAVLFTYEECLCQIIDHYKSQKKPIPSNKELLEFFKRAIKNNEEALSEYRNWNSR